MPSRPVLLCSFNGERFIVDKDRFIIGRTRPADLPVRDGNISRKHAAIERQRDGWTLRDLGSTGGIDLRGRRITGLVRLEPGQRFQFASHVLEVIDLAYVARPGEFTPRIDREVTFECERLLFTGRIALASMTASAEVERRLAEVIVRCAGGPLTGERAPCVEPVDAVLAMRALVDAVEASPLAGVRVSARLHRLVAGASALELLLEPSTPAREAWQWIARHCWDLPTLAGLQMRGLATIFGGRFEELPAELAGEAGLDEPGLIVWLVHGPSGVLIRIDRAICIGNAEGDDIRIESSLYDASRARIERAARGWVAAVEPVDPGLGRPASVVQLAVGVTVDLGMATMRVVAVQSATTTS